METGNIQENRAAERDGSRKAKERVKPELSRETPETTAQDLIEPVGGRRKSSVGAVENDCRWSGKKMMREKPHVCWSLALLCTFSFNTQLFRDHQP